MNIPRWLLPVVLTLACRGGSVAGSGDGGFDLQDGPAAPAVAVAAEGRSPSPVPPRPGPLAAPEPIRLWGRNLARLPAPQAGIPRVLVLGDSVAAGFGLQPGEEPFPTLLARRLAHEDGLAVEMLNGGIFGGSTSGGLVLADLGSLRPDVVVIELGGNDWLVGMPVERTRENLRAMVAAARGMGAGVLLVGVRLPPFLLDTPRGRAFDALWPELAAELDVPLVPDMFEDMLGVPRFMQPDLIHPTAEGQMVVADHVLPALRELLRARAAR